MSDAPTGGNVYDRRLIAELLARGVDLHEHLVHRTWPRLSRSSTTSWVTC
jgi:hypothetical protein